MLLVTIVLVMAKSVCFSVEIKFEDCREDIQENLVCLQIFCVYRTSCSCKPNLVVYFSTAAKTFQLSKYVPTGRELSPATMPFLLSFRV